MVNMLTRCRYIGPFGRSGKAIRGFPGHLPGSGRQLPEIDSKIRFIVQVYKQPFVTDVLSHRLYQDFFLNNNQKIINALLEILVILIVIVPPIYSCDAKKAHRFLRQCHFHISCLKIMIIRTYHQDTKERENKTIACCRYTFTSASLIGRGRNLQGR